MGRSLFGELGRYGRLYINGSVRLVDGEIEREPNAGNILRLSFTGCGLPALAAGGLLLCRRAALRRAAA